MTDSPKSKSVQPSTKAPEQPKSTQAEPEATAYHRPLIPHVHPAQGMPENWHPGLETHAATDPASTPVSNAAPKQRPPRKPHTTTHRHIEWDVDPDMVLRDADVNSSSFGRPRIGIARTADPLARYRGTGSVMKALATGLPVAALILGAVLALDHLNRAHRNQLKHPSTNRHIP